MPSGSNKSRKSKKLKLARKAHAARFKSNIRTESKDQPIEASTSLKCYNVTDESIFVEGLNRAGLKVVPQRVSSENDSNKLVIVVQSQMDAYQIMRALHGCELEGQTMHINIIDIGKKVGNVKVPKVKDIRSCVLEIFREKRFKKDGIAQENSEFGAAWQEVCNRIKASNKKTKKQKVNQDLMKVQEEAVAMEMSVSGNDESRSLGEEIHGEKSREERGEMRDDGFRPETSTTQQEKAGETQSDILSERCQIQDTARMITATRAPTPDDFLSALYASLK